jgi:hypothetical protein
MSDPYDDLDRAHRLIGRFLWAFANVECDLNELLIVLFDLNETAKLILLNSVDVRKKIDWAVIAMREPPSSISDGSVTTSKRRFTSFMTSEISSSTVHTFRNLLTA